MGHSDRQVDHLLTYIGFDSVSTAAEEAKNPQRDIAVPTVLTGLAPWQSMADDPAPVDGLLPRIFGKVHPKFRAPSTATWIAGLRSRHSGGAYRAGPQRHSVLARR